MGTGVYKVTLEIDLLKDIKEETLETFFRTVLEKSGSIVLLNMSKPVAVDSDQAVLEAILLEGIKKAALDDDLSRLMFDKRR